MSSDNFSSNFKNTTKTINNINKIKHLNVNKKCVDFEINNVEDLEAISNFENTFSYKKILSIDLNNIFDKEDYYKVLFELFNITKINDNLANKIFNYINLVQKLSKLKKLKHLYFILNNKKAFDNYVKITILSKQQKLPHYENINYVNCHNNSNSKIDNLLLKTCKYISGTNKNLLMINRYNFENNTNKNINNFAIRKTDSKYYLDKSLINNNNIRLTNDIINNINNNNIYNQNSNNNINSQLESNYLDKFSSSNNIVTSLKDIKIKKTDLSNSMSNDKRNKFKNINTVNEELFLLTKKEDNKSDTTNNFKNTIQTNYLDYKNFSYSKKFYLKALIVTIFISILLVVYIFFMFDNANIIYNELTNFFELKRHIVNRGIYSTNLLLLYYNFLVNKRYNIFDDLIDNYIEKIIDNEKNLIDNIYNNKYYNFNKMLSNIEYKPTCTFLLNMFNNIENTQKYNDLTYDSFNNLTNNINNNFGSYYNEYFDSYVYLYNNSTLVFIKELCNKDSQFFSVFNKSINEIIIFYYNKIKINKSEYVKYLKDIEVNNLKFDTKYIESIMQSTDMLLLAVINQIFINNIVSIQSQYITLDYNAFLNNNLRDSIIKNIVIILFIILIYGVYYKYFNYIVKSLKIINELFISIIPEIYIANKLHYKNILNLKQSNSKIIVINEEEISKN